MYISFDSYSYMLFYHVIATKGKKTLEKEKRLILFIIY